MKVALLLIVQVISSAGEGSCLECFDGDEGLKLLQHRSIATASTVEAEARGNATEEDPSTRVLRGSVVTALLEGLHAVPLRLSYMQVVWLYSLWPSIWATGLPALRSRGGLMEVLAFVAFWVVLRPCASMLQVFTSFDPATMAAPHSVSVTGVTPAAMALAAHFYWCWGLFELVIRQRPLTHRLLAVTALALLCLPVPLAELSLGALPLPCAASAALLGDALGIAFFFSLRTAPCWRLIQALQRGKPIEGSATVPRFHDNLTTFWGGCSWPAVARAAPSWHPSLGACKVEHDDSPKHLAHDLSEDEDFKLVRRNA